MQATRELGQTTKAIRKIGVYRRFFKRPLDFVLALAALIIFSPLLILIAILVRSKLGSPVLFKQKRPGLNNEIFTMYKFRTMTDERDQDGNLLADELRLTRFGKLLRSTSLDELPELINILKGDMSIVGPRPLLIKDMVFFSKEEMKRQTVLPGLSGLAQVNGRNSILWEDKFRFDLQYIENITFGGDLKIIFRTFISVLKREGISHEEMATAEDLGDYLFRKRKIDGREYFAKIEQSKVLSMEGLSLKNTG